MHLAREESTFLGMLMDVQANNPVNRSKENQSTWAMYDVICSFEVTMLPM
jgi:hypothetical protein